ncbi:MAG: FkbM family methyltransferase [Lachnospiraceae bacterium]|nr:FkbM family methyltransferase [Lachnospiraceae bacterium]
MSTITSTIKKLRLFTQNHIRGTVLGDGFINFLKALGINDCFTRILYAQDRQNPTPSMRYAKKYFAEHQKETEEIASFFADDFSREVYFSIIKYRITHNPKELPAYSKHDQYFVKDIVPLTDTEVFIDCGAFDGDTMKDFIKVTKGNYQSIVCFEPVDEFHKKLEKRGAGKKVTAICAGVYKESTTLQFNAEAGKGSSISSNAENTISVPVRAIDDVPECENATFIKMDVEGSELDALKGAKQTILRNKPKLAICLYHKTKDFIEIPTWIHTLVPEYKLYVRHHSFSVNETVLYAIPPETE